MNPKKIQVSADNLTFKYSRKIIALKNISFKMIAGERVALIGHNGSGKSTLARHLNGMLHPFSGKLWIQGIDSSTQKVSQLAKKTALLFQNPDDQICRRTVRDEVAFGPGNLGYSKEKTDRLVNRALSDFDLSPFQKTNPHDLGLSERKRVAMASILSMDTPIIVFDEPTAGLDPYEIKLLITTLQRLKDEEKTVLIITHDMDFVAENIPRAICLQNGEKIFDGNCRKLFSNQKLLSNCRLVAPQVVRLSTLFQQTTTALTPEEFVDMHFHVQAGPLF